MDAGGMQGREAVSAASGGVELSLLSARLCLEQALQLVVDAFGVTSRVHSASDCAVTGKGALLVRARRSPPAFWRRLGSRSRSPRAVSAVPGRSELLVAIVRLCGLLEAALDRLGGRRC